VTQQADTTYEVRFAGDTTWGLSASPSLPVRIGGPSATRVSVDRTTSTPQTLVKVESGRFRQLPAREGTILRGVKDRLQPTKADTSWAERYYPAALEDEVPEPFRTGVRDRLAGRIEFIGAADQRVVETWNAATKAT